MSQIQFKNLPKGFEYPITRKEMRGFLSRTNANYVSVVSTGHYHESFSTKWYESWTYWTIGRVKCFRSESEWCFRIELQGLRSERYEDRREEIAQALLSEIQSWTDKKLALLPTASEKPNEALVCFDLTKPNIANISEVN